MIVAHYSIAPQRLRGSLRLLTTSVAVFCGLLSSPSYGQLFDRALVIKNARILGGDGSVMENASILVKGSSIAAIGKEVSAPFLSSIVNAEGKTVTPGLIDAWSSLGRLGSGNEMSATHMAWDSFDRYDRAAYREALQRGVTAVYLTPGQAPGINGQGAIVKLAPDAAGSAGVLLDRAAALGISFGSDQSATRRAKTFRDIRKQFRKALDYRQSLEDYDEDLKEYLKKLAERKEAEAKKDEAKKGESKGDGEDGEEQGSEEGKESPKKASRGSSSARPAIDHAVMAQRDSTNRPLGGGKKKDEAGDDSAKKDKNGDEKKEDELKKPAQPKRDAESEVLLSAIDRELLVRVEAYRSSDIFNALALAEEFNLDMLIEGGTESYLLADELAESKTTVVLGSVARPLIYDEGRYRRHTPRTMSVLQAAGASWAIGSGAENPRSARFVGLNAQLALRHSSEAISWLQAVTSLAAKALRHSDSIGRLAVGMDADFVIWDGAPGDPASQVERVYVSGKLAYSAPAGGKRKP